MNLPLLKRCAIIGVNWGGFIAANPNESRPVLTALLELIASGKINPQAGETFALEDPKLKSPTGQRAFDPFALHPKGFE